MGIMTQKDYLGDSVYAAVDPFGALVLTTENGLPDDPSNTIILEPEVARALLRYIDRVYNQLPPQRSQPT